jgi:prolyl oligopeptidase PreP (S9A serine peptidase family)
VLVYKYSRSGMDRLSHNSNSALGGSSSDASASTTTSTLIGPLIFGTSALASLSISYGRHRYGLLRPVATASTEDHDHSSVFSCPTKVIDNVEYWLEKESETDFLEDIRGDSAMAWVKSCNERTIQCLGNPYDSPLYTRILSVLNNNDKIPYVTKIGNMYYNIWKDAKNKNGLIRRTTLSSYRPSDPAWEVVLDLDELSKLESENWLFDSWTVYEPNDIGINDNDTEPCDRMLIHLSPGGSDAIVVREFDLRSLKFIDPNSVEMGFYIPLGKSQVAWKSRHTLLVSVNLNEDEDMTSSGYPRKVREWVRGSKLSESKVVFTASETDVVVQGYMVSN